MQAREDTHGEQRRGPGRPRKRMPRTSAVMLRFTPEERARLEDEADRAGVDALATYLRMRVLGALAAAPTPSGSPAAPAAAP